MKQPAPFDEVSKEAVELARLYGKSNGFTANASGWVRDRRRRLVAHGWREFYRARSTVIKSWAECETDLPLGTPVADLVAVLPKVAKEPRGWIIVRAGPGMAKLLACQRVYDNNVGFTRDQAEQEVARLNSLVLSDFWETVRANWNSAWTIAGEITDWLIAEKNITLTVPEMEKVADMIYRRRGKYWSDKRQEWIEI